MTTSALELVKILWKDGEQGNQFFVDRSNGNKAYGEWTDVLNPKLIPQRASVDAYLSVNATRNDSKVSTNGKLKVKDIGVINALFAEFDVGVTYSTKEDIGKFLKHDIDIRPSIVIDSGNGYHCLWLLRQPFYINTPEDRDRVKHIQREWAKMIGADEQSADLARSFRIPGTINYKPGRDEAKVQLKIFEPTSRNSLERFEERVPARVYKVGTDITKSSKMSVARIRHYLDRLDDWRADDRGEWIRVGMAINSAQPNEDGLMLWDDFSQRSMKYRGLHEVESIWNGFSPHMEDGVKIGTLVSMADEDNPISIVKTITESVVVETDIDGKSVLAEIPSDLQFTDVGMGIRFANEHQYHIRNVGSDRWYEFQGGRWTETDKISVRKIAQEMARSLLAEAATLEDTKLVKDMGLAALRMMSTYGVNAALKEGAPHLYMKESEFDCQPDLLNLRNGTVNLETMEFMPHNPEHLLRQQAEVDFVAGADCPFWREFLNLYFEGNEELIRYVQKCLGYSIGGRAGQKAWFFMYGRDGNNGKSTIVETMFRILGSYGLKTSTETIMTGQKSYRNSSATYFVAELEGKRFVSGSEVEEGDKLLAAMMKDLSGGDTQVARSPYGRPINFESMAKLWFYGNHKPRIDDESDATWKRVKTIPFNYTIPDADIIEMDEIHSMLEPEYPGILNWLLEGYKLAREEGLKNEPTAVIEAVNAYRLSMDPLRQFVDDCCEITPGILQPKKGFVETFNRWMLNIDPSRKKWTGTKVTQRLATMGIEAGGSNKYAYKDITIVEYR